MGLFGLFKSSKTVVVDGVSLNEALGMKGNIPPRNQLQMLRRLARFAEREKLDLVVVLSGSPLHKAPAGKKFEGIAVLYSKSSETHAKNVAKIAISKGAILVSSHPAAEKIALGRGVLTMRMSTFRKASDFGGNESDAASNRSDRGGGERNNRNRPPRRRSQKKPAGEKKTERPPKESSDSDAINELIDLID